MNLIAMKTLRKISFLLCFGASFFIETALAVNSPRIYQEMTWTIYDYGKVPDNFIPPLPPLPNSNEYIALLVRMDKVKIGALIEIRISIFTPNAYIGYMSDDRWPFDEIVNEDVSAIWREQKKQGKKPLVISCRYIDKKSNLISYANFWFRERPSYADPSNLIKRLRGHPMIRLNPPINHCALTFKEAYKLKEPYKLEPISLP